MPFICTIASGSSGNSAVVSDGRTHILVDAGVSCRRIFQGLKELDIAPEDLSGVLITHEHNDHVRGLELLCVKTGVPVFTASATASLIERQMPRLYNSIKVIGAGEPFEIGDIGISAFDTPHDTPQSLGFSMTVDGYRLAYMTDIGCVTGEMLDAVRGAEYICVESNHDLMMLLGGGYPEYLKRRIMSKRGHLSNTDCGDFISQAVEWGAHEFLLCHLSRENNQPRIAYDEAVAAVKAAGATTGDGIGVHVAPPGGLSHICRFGESESLQLVMQF